jgi:hypothetical protein
MRQPRAHPPRRPPSLTRRPSLAAAFPSGCHAPTLPCCCRAPIPHRRARRPPGRGKPSATSNGDGGGARTMPAPTPTAGIARPRAPPCFVHMFQMFRTYVSSVSCGCCKSRLRCSICCNDYTRMLQVYVPNVSSIF